MSGFRNRLTRLERTLERALEAARRRRDTRPINDTFDRMKARQLQQAIRRLWRVLDTVYPTKHDVRAAAARLQACVPDERDRTALAELPAEELKTLGQSAEDFVIAVGTLPEEKTPELEEEMAQYVRWMDGGPPLAQGRE
jgi:hypothetical protein